MAAAPSRRISIWVVMVGVVTALAGLLFGYDQGVISGALHFIKQDFDLSTTLVETITSWVTLGALFGALAGGALADRIGRRGAGMLAGLLFAVGALTQALAPDTPVLVLGRLVIGIGVGVASVAAPLYAAEMAPTRVRGRMVTIYQLAITVGIFVAYLADDLLSETGDWRLMLGLAAVPGVLLVVGMLVVPASARWLVEHGRRQEARESLGKVEPALDPDASIAALKTEIAHEQRASWGEVFGSANRSALWVGVGLAIFQQVTGINAIIYYADQIFDLAGFTSPTSQADATLFAVGGVNMLATLIAVAFVDRLGRRPLLLSGLVGMIASLLTVGFAFELVDTGSTTRGVSVLGVVTLVGLVVYIASFAFSLGPVTWTMINEIFPTRVRGRAVSVATALNWGSAFLVSQFFLTMVDDVGTSLTFFTFGALSVAAFWWIRRKVPETKERSLEDIQEIWRSDDPVATSLELHPGSAGKDAG